MVCKVCGHEQGSYRYRNIITPELAKIWRLKKAEIRGFSRRESSHCRKCGSSLRSRSLAEAIMLSYPESKAIFFIDWVVWAKAKKLTIAEINYCGQLHQYLAINPGTKTSQYCESTLRARIANFLKGIRSEDISKLSYQSGSFDLVLHSEVLEHVDNVDKALKECRRILKPGGICVFTVPLIMSRKTKRKARIDPATKSVNYYDKPSFHGSGEEDNLVFWEFGGDFIKKNNLKIVLAHPEDFIWVLKMDY